MIHFQYVILPFTDAPLFVSFFSVILQSLYTAVSLYLSNVPGIEHDFHPGYIKYPLIMAILWPVALLIVSEIMKRKYIK